MGEWEPIPYRIWIGITGHRDAVADPGIERRVEEVIARLRRQAAAAGFADVCFGVVSALARGPDQYVARTVLREPGTLLAAVLPMSVAKYKPTLGDEASVREFESLLGIASSMRQIEPQGSSSESYAAAGTAIIDSCDVLVAVLDQSRPRREGGTAAVVEEARHHRHAPAVYRIDPTTFDLDVDKRPVDFRALRRIGQLNREGRRASGEPRWSQELHRAAAAAQLDGDVIEPVLGWAEPVFTRADALALRLRRRERYARLVLFLGAATAVLLATVELTYSPGNDWLSISELLVLVLLLTAVVTARRSRWHADWLTFRALAENARSMFFVNLISTQGGAAGVPIEGPPERMTGNRWVSHVCLELVRRWPSPQDTRCPAHAVKAFLEQAWVEPQITYYAGTERRSRKAEAVFTWVIATLFAVTCLAVLAHDAGAGDWHRGADRLMAFLAIVIPGVAGAVTGLRDSAELQRHAARSRHMAQRLHSLRWQLHEASTPVAIRRVALRIWQQLAAENADWFDLMVFQELELHV